jgi:hypothetical protein
MKYAPLALSSPHRGIGANLNISSFSKGGLDLYNPVPSRGGLDLCNSLPFKGRVRVGMG